MYYLHRICQAPFNTLHFVKPKYFRAALTSLELSASLPNLVNIVKAINGTRTTTTPSLLAIDIAHYATDVTAACGSQTSPLSRGWGTHRAHWPLHTSCAATCAPLHLLEHAREAQTVPGIVPIPPIHRSDHEPPPVNRELRRAGRLCTMGREGEKAFGGASRGVPHAGG